MIDFVMTILVVIGAMFTTITLATVFGCLEALVERSEDGHNN